MSLQLVPIRNSDYDQQLYLLSETLNKVIAGRANNTGSFTLAAGTTTTTVVDPAFESSMIPNWAPTTANAAGAMTNLYLSARANGTFTLTHANSGQVDRAFLYTRQG